MPLASPYPSLSIPNASVFDALFADLSESDADRTAIIDGTTGANLTYGTVKSQIEAAAAGLAARGVQAGDVVALHAPNVPAFVIAFHGILRAGAVASPVNALYTSDEIAFQLRDSGAKLLMTVSPFLPQAQAAAAAAGLDAERIIVLDGAEGYTSLRDLTSTGMTAPSAQFDAATHLAVLPYSSGTTGTPKGVMLTHRNLVANVLQSAVGVAVQADDVLLAVLPFTHIYGLTVLLNLAIKERARLVTMPRFDLREFLRLIQDHRCTYLFVAPPIALALAKSPLVDDFDLSSVRAALSGAAPLDEELGRTVGSRLNARMLQGYGMTEMSPVSHLTPLDRPELSPGSIGFAVANTEVKIIDTITGEELDPPAVGLSSPGELLVRGPQVMIGYLGRPDATSETLDAAGWLHTGDIAQIDADGVTWVVDRLKELIKVKGHQVPPAELEAILLTNEKIADAAVIGVPDDEYGEVPKGFVVTAPGEILTESEAIEFVRTRVASYKRLRLVEFVDAIPKSGSGKILRKDLRNRVSAQR